MPAKMTINDSFYQKVSEVKMRLAMEKAVKQTMYDLMKASMKEAPGPGRSRTPNPTGNLRRSHSIDVRLGSNMVEGLLKNSAEYWQYVNFGTSRMDADDFLTRAVSSVVPEHKVAEYFHQYYKGGE